ncbi:unnamed protein product [Moneuplotes crassus]|uniref:Uncharacterized protein n=1 Tax=Euplotes crassus TaxID=5936 RepID=A0AAD1USG7_EUPCR|nr:unnamed protein product [Moneuplotes crassus]
MKTFAIIALVGVASLALYSMAPSVDSGVETKFQEFLATYGQNYGTTEEYNYRLGVFKSNLESIAQMNAEDQGVEFAINEFADQTPEEFAVRFGFKQPVGTKKSTATHVKALEGDNKDWSGMWESVKNQGACGSCWAFSAAATFEARYELAHGQTNTDALYSEQELVDCEPQSDGCEGGLMDFAFEYLVDQAFCTEQQYPYTARDETCKVTKCAGGPNDAGFTDVAEKDEQALVDELMNGPVAVAVDASRWQFYRKGIFSNCRDSLNHGVTLVGVNFDEESLKIRNSWGKSWGESGHIRLALNKNTCGVAEAASVPTF